MRYFRRFGMIYVEHMFKAWNIKYNPANGVYFVLNVKSGKQWELRAVEFVLNQGMYNPIVESFPDYVHEAVWLINNIKHKVENNEVSREIAVKEQTSNLV